MPYSSVTQLTSPLAAPDLLRQGDGFLFHPRLRKQFHAWCLVLNWLWYGVFQVYTLVAALSEAVCDVNLKVNIVRQNPITICLSFMGCLEQSVAQFS